MKDKATSFNIFKTLTKKEQIIFILYDFPNSKIEEIEQLFSNNSNFSNKDNYNNYNYQITINNKTISDLLEQNYIIQNKNNNPRTFQITKLGCDFVEAKIKPEIEQIEKEQENNRLKERNAQISQELKDFWQFCELDKYNSENPDKKYYYVDFKKICSFSLLLAEYLADNPLDFIDLSVRSIKIQYNLDFEVYFRNLSKDLQRNITNLRKKDHNKLVSIVGEVRSRSKAELTLKEITFECPSCANIMKIPQEGQKIKKPYKCACGRKGAFKILNEEHEDLLKITLWDLYEDLEINQVPEEINVLFEKDHFNFNTVEEGQKIRINGIFKTIRQEDTKTQTTKIIKCFGIERLGANYTKTTITLEDEAKFIEINKDPLGFYNKTVFSDVKNNKEAKTLMALSNYGKINALFLGDPGTGKSMICKRVVKYSLKGTHLDAMKTSRSGLSGAATKNEFTGKYSLDAGAIRKIHPDGVCVIDEIQFNKELQKDLYSIISDKRIRIAKANINAEFPFDINVVATANPAREDFNTNQPLSNIFDIEKALMDRFGFIVFFNSKTPSKEMIYDMCSVHKKAQKDWSYTEEERKNLDILRKHQIRARNIMVELKDEDYKNIALWISDFWYKITGKKASHRATSQMINLLESWCKIHHRDYTIKEDYQEITDLFLGLEKLKNEFLLENKDDFMEDYVK